MANVHNCRNLITEPRVRLKYQQIITNSFVDVWIFINLYLALVFCLLVFSLTALNTLPSVLWHCWLGGRKGIRPVKKLNGGVLAWLPVWSAVQSCLTPIWCHWHSLSLALVKSRLVLPFWYRLTRVVPDKRQLNGCVWTVFVLSQSRWQAFLAHDYVVILLLCCVTSVRDRWLSAVEILLLRLLSF